MGGDCERDLLPPPPPRVCIWNAMTIRHCGDRPELLPVTISTRLSILRSSSVHEWEGNCCGERLIELHLLVDIDRIG